MGDPDPADESEAYEVPEKVRPELQEGPRKGDRKGRNSQLEYENRDGDGENAVGKGIEPVEGKNACAALRGVARVTGLIVYIGHDDLVLILEKAATLMAALPSFVCLSGLWNEHLQSTRQNPSADWRLASRFTIPLYRLGRIGFNYGLAHLPVLDNSLSFLQSDDEHIFQQARRVQLGLQKDFVLVQDTGGTPFRAILHANGLSRPPGKPCPTHT
jgi:hypothetical protein